MNRIPAKQAKDSLGRLMDTARSARIVLSVHEYARLNATASKKAGE